MILYCDFDLIIETLPNSAWTCDASMDASKSMSKLVEQEH